MFIMCDGKAKDGLGSNTWIGLAFLAASLLLDGYTGPGQEKLVSRYNPPLVDIMVFMNAYAACVFIVPLLMTNQISSAVLYFQLYPEALYTAVISALLLACGQLAIIYTVCRFDSLVLTTITTTRKFATLLASAAIYGHNLTVFQWIGACAVFAGVALCPFFKAPAKPKSA
jgi:UDP-galactose transporter B1